MTERAVSDQFCWGYRGCYGVAARAVILLAHVPVLASCRWPWLLSPLIGLDISTVLYLFLVPFLGPEMRSPSERPQPSDSAKQHVVLVSHHRESHFIAERTLRALDAGASRAAWPVAVVHAVEADAPLKAQGWDLSSATGNLRPYLVAVHERGVPGERPGLGSNLRNAVRFVVEESSIPVRGTMLTKLDGNAVVPEDFFATLEAAWCRTGCSDDVAFQTGVLEIGHDEWKSLGLLSRLNSYLAGLIHHIPTTLFPRTGFHSSFCLPLVTVLRAGSWDPWLIQEDYLACHRAVLSTRGRLQVRLLPSFVFNAPALSNGAMLDQHRRCVVHMWYATGFALCHLWDARRGLGLGFAVRHSLSLANYALFAVLNAWLVPAIVIQAWATANSPGREALGVGTVIYCILTLGSARAAMRWEAAMLLMPCFAIASAWHFYYETLRFLFFARDAAESFKTTATLDEPTREDL